MPADLRSGIADLATLANGDLRIIWKSVTTAAEAKAALIDVLPALVDAYGSAAATLAADWYDESRIEAAARGRFRAIPAVVPDPGAESLAEWGTRPLRTAEPDFSAAKVLINGGLQRRISNVSRLTITGSVTADPQARGWKRVGAGACAFCRMLIERNHLYTEAASDFASHDHCNCQAVADFVGAEPIDVEKYVQSERRITDADRSRVREWLRTH